MSLGSLETSLETPHCVLHFLALYSLNCPPNFLRYRSFPPPQTVILYLFLSPWTPLAPVVVVLVNRGWTLNLRVFQPPSFLRNLTLVSSLDFPPWESATGKSAFLEEIGPVIAIPLVL